MIQSTFPPWCSGDCSFLFCFARASNRNCSDTMVTGTCIQQCFSRTSFQLYHGSWSRPQLSIALRILWHNTMYCGCHFGQGIVQLSLLLPASCSLLFCWLSPWLPSCDSTWSTVLLHPDTRLCQGASLLFSLPPWGHCLTKCPLAPHVKLA